METVSKYGSDMSTWAVPKYEAAKTIATPHLEMVRGSVLCL